MGENMNQLESMELTSPLTPEQIKAFEILAQNALELYERIFEALRELANVVTKIVNNIVDKLLHFTNDNPKWWHLYKHAKKYRTRKKYRNRLMRKLLSTLREAIAQEA